MFPQFDPDMLARLLRGQTQVDAPSPVQLDPTAAGPPQPQPVAAAGPALPPVQLSPAEAKAAGGGDYPLAAQALNPSFAPPQSQPMASAPVAQPFAAQIPSPGLAPAFEQPAPPPFLNAQGNIGGGAAKGVTAPFQPRTIDVGAGLGAIALPRQVTSRDEELMALQEQAFNRARANAVGNDWYRADPALGVHAGNAAAQAFLQASIGSEDARSRLDVAGLQGMNALDLGRMQGSNQLQMQGLQNEGMLRQAMLKAHTDHNTALNNLEAQAAAALASGNLTPAKYEATLAVIAKQRAAGPIPGGIGPSALGSLDSIDKGMGTGLPGQSPMGAVLGAAAPTPAGGAAAVDPSKAISQINADEAAVTDAFRPVVKQGLDEKGNPTVAGLPAIDSHAANELIDRLGRLSPTQLDAAITKLKAGAYGDPEAITNAILGQTAIANYKVQPANYSTRANPSNAAPNYVVVGDDKKPLYTYSVGPTTRLNAAKNAAISGVPYNRVGLPGRTPIEISPADLSSEIADLFGRPQNADTNNRRASTGANILRRLIAEREALQQPK